MPTTGRNATTDRIDLPVLDPAFKADPHSRYAEWRAQGRTIVPIRLPTGLEAWLVIGHDAARELLSDPRLSKVAPDGGGPPAHPLFRHMLTLDPPEHTRLRSIIAREFTVRRVGLLRPRIREIVVRLIEAASRAETADLVQALALPLPLEVICALIGMPAGDDGRVLRWSQRLAAADLDAPADVPAIADEIHEHLSRLAAGKRRAPDDSLLSGLVAAQDRGELSGTELTAMTFLLLSAGHETTANLIGNGVLALLRSPARWAALCANEDLARATVEEVLRFESPLEVATIRHATDEIPLGDASIRPGDTVFIGLAAANRDPRRFERAGEFDPGRHPAAAHLAFGHGVHYCVGATLARAEGEVAFVELSRRFPRLALDIPFDELEWTPGLIMRGPRRLPIRFDRSIRTAT